MSVDPVAVYIHTPFCPSKCGYCDFNSYAMTGDIIPRTVDATRQQILNSPWAGRPAKSIFFGGGTPTFLEEQQLIGLLEAVMKVHPPIPDCEITSEANPGTVDAEKFVAMKRAGFDRISMGAQSFDTSDLLRLGRIHQPDHIGRALGLARRAGFDNVNLDLMFALPGQSLRAWKNNLDLAFQLRPDHLSLYCLTIEPNTRFYRHTLKGFLDLPDEESQVNMYNLALEECAKNGFVQYEISNFCRPGRESLHNLAYWRGEEYLAYGPGAVGQVDDIRMTNIKHPDRYSAAIEKNESPWMEEESLDQSTRNFERIMMGIRLNEGLGKANLELDPVGIKDAISKGWIIETDDRLLLTEPGRHFCSKVAVLLSPAE